MKFFTKKIILYPLLLILTLFVLLVITDKLVIPWYVEAPEFTLPNLVGKDKAEAIKILEDLKLHPMEEGPKFDENIPKNRVISHRPNPGSLVKEGRRVYLYISGGEPLISTPVLRGKTQRDAKITIERKGLILGEIKEEISEFEANIVIEQDPEPGVNIERGSVVNLTVSVGPRRGKIRVPNIMGKPLTQAEKILRSNSLKLGRITYQQSRSMLPNTIYDQIPSEGRFINVGDSVDVWVYKEQ